MPAHYKWTFMKIDAKFMPGKKEKIIALETDKKKNPILYKVKRRDKKRGIVWLEKWEIQA